MSTKRKHSLFDPFKEAASLLIYIQKIFWHRAVYEKPLMALIWIGLPMFIVFFNWPYAYFTISWLLYAFIVNFAYFVVTPVLFYRISTKPFEETRKNMLNRATKK